MERRQELDWSELVGSCVYVGCQCWVVMGELIVWSGTVWWVGGISEL